MKRILVLSPHPDDEAIGCGGTLRSHIEAGASVHVVFLTSGEKGGHGRNEDETRRLREQEAQEAARILGIERTEFYHEPDSAVRATADLVERLRTKISSWRPNRIYLPHDREMHPDHRSTVRALRKALQSDNGKASKRPDVLMFEIWTPLQQMDEIVDISPYVEIKRAAIQAYRSQCEVLAFEEAILGLNRYRGEMHSWPGGDYAEIFVRLRLE